MLKNLVLTLIPFVVGVAVCLAAVIFMVIENNVEKKIARILQNFRMLNDQELAHLLYLAHWLNMFNPRWSRYVTWYCAHEKKTLLAHGVVTKLVITQRGETIWWISWVGNPRRSVNPEFTVPDPIEIDVEKFEEFKDAVIHECLKRYT